MNLLTTVMRSSILLLLLGSYTLAQQQTVEPQSGKEWNMRIGGYGMVLFQHFDYGANQNLPGGSLPDSRSSINIPRFNLAFDYNFGDGFVFESEIEFEYGGAGTAMELEYEEFGEYEMEVEKGGEVGLEQMNLAKYFIPEFNIRVGHFVVPVGLVNRIHVPTKYFATVRSESESTIIPVTWHETGIEIFGESGDFSYTAQIINGLDASGFSSRNWIVEGRQGKFEDIKITNPAYAGRLDFSPTHALSFGASGYYGNTTGNRPKKDMEGIDGHVAIAGADARYQSERIQCRAFALRGSLENSALISTYNATLSRNLQSVRTPVGKTALAYGIEAGYDVLPLFTESGGRRLFPFIRYEYSNPMEETEHGVFAVPRFENTVLTLGVNFYLKKNIVLKADYSIRRVGGGAFNEEHTLGLALEFISRFFEN